MEKTNPDTEAIIDNLLMQVATLSVKLNVLNSMTIGVFKEILPPESFRNNYTIMVNLLDEQLNEAIETLSDAFHQPTFALRQKMNVMAEISDLKTSTFYNTES